MEFTEEKIVSNIQPQIEKCRPGDWEHAKRVVKWIKILGRERNDLPLLITAGYIHDIGWRGLVGKEKITFEKLLELEPQANKNSESCVIETLERLDCSESEIATVLRLVSAADKHASSSDDEEIIVDADQLSKLDIQHLKEKFPESDWMKMHDLWKKDFGKRIKTNEGRKLYPDLLDSLLKAITTS